MVNLFRWKSIRVTFGLREDQLEWVVIVVGHLPDEETNFHVVLEDENARRG